MRVPLALLIALLALGSSRRLKRREPRAAYPVCFGIARGMGLKQAGVNGRLTKAQSAGAIKWLEGRLAKSAITPAQLSSLAPSALTPRAASALP